MSTNVIDFENIKDNAKRAAALLKALSNESRLMILCHLGENELSVTELNKLIDLSQSSLSQHLARLRQDGFVSTRRESQTIYYRVENPVAMKIILVLQDEFCKK
ncbi:ArsR/SmtB family transcription factor [Thalassotalea atypica]|uniref:ArsR/SmtB family transcription factor n=1 Tax=Thalassotalea atypica TaxID=2054316 RepID=UPI0025724C7B|nr:metalloregulator ArsR/SmtB family transcription factor [Thalassotalea atypica]